MIASPIRLTVAPGTLRERVIVGWDDILAGLPGVAVDAAPQEDEGIGAEWAGLAGLGNVKGALEVERVRAHAGPAQAANAMLDAASDDAAYAHGLRMEIANPLLGPGTPDRERLLATIDYAEAAMTDARHGLDSADPSRTRHVWNFAVGPSTAEIAPILPVVTGILQTSVAEADGAGIVEHDGQKWLRIAVRMPAEFTGNPVDGWLDAAEERLISLEWSVDLQTWATGHFQAAPGVADVVSGGWRTTWVETIHPQDAGELVSDMRLVWDRNPSVIYESWEYEQDFMGLWMAGEIQPLDCPYAMPAEAARLQADIRALGWTGATVTTDDVEERWEIFVPNVATTNYQHAPGANVSPGFSYINNKDELAWSGIVGGHYENPRFGPGLDPFVIYPKQFARGRVTRL